MFTHLIWVTIAKSVPVSAVSPSSDVKVHTFTAKERRRAKWAILVLSCVIIGLTLAYATVRNWPTNKVIVLVARFEDPANPAETRYKVTEEIVESLRNRTKAFRNLEIRTVNTHFDFADGRENARSIGIANKAALVIWGNLSKTDQKARLNVNVELLTKPRKLTLVKEQIISYVPVNDIETYQAQIDLSNQLSYLTLVIDGLLQNDAENYREAVERFTEALSQPNLRSDLVNVSDVYYFRATARSLQATYLVADEGANAIADLDEAIRLKPDFAEAHTLRGLCSVLIGRRTQAVKDLDRAIQLNPDSSLNYLYQGLAYSLKYQFDLAEDSLRKVTEKEPLEPADFLIRGTAQLFQNRPDLAIQSFDRVSALSPSYESERLFLSILAYLGKREFDVAFELIGRIEERRPGFYLIHLLRAACYSGKGEDDLALSELNIAIEKNPGAGMLYHGRAQLLINLENHDAALSDLTKAIELSSKNPALYAGRASLFATRKEWEK
ncbi:MAG: tetratricopeptide repeat protein, partial [Acidobacteriota bacterium]